MKKTIVLASIVAILFSLFTFLGTEVYATTDHTDYTAVHLTGIDSLTITRTVSDVTNNVTNTFTYTITEESKPALAGETGMPTSTTVVFNNVEPDENHVATARTTLDLSTLNFDELGDYVYTIKETSSTYAGTYPVDPEATTTYYLYISARNDTEADGTPKGTLIATILGGVLLNNAGDKTTSDFTSASQHTYIELDKKVTGNLARTDTYFPFEITFEDDCIAVGDKLVVTNTVSGRKYYNEEGTSTEVTVEEGKKIIVYLKHGDHVTIGKVEDGLYQLPIGLKYTIAEKTDTRKEAETDSREEDYKAYIDGSTSEVTNKTSNQKTTVEVGNTNFNTNNKTAYVNNREAQAVTGVFINIIPFIALIAVAFIIIVLVKKTSRKEEN